MKFLIKSTIALISFGIVNVGMAQEVTQAQKDGSAGLVAQCVITKAPANWEVIVTAIDRTNAKKSVLYNAVWMAKANKLVDIDITGCDTKKQALDLLQFQAVIPAAKKNWKILYLSFNANGQYQLFTDADFKK